MVLSGREAGNYAVVVRLDGAYVWLADGRKRPFAKPKRKNKRHIQPTKYIAQTVRDAIVLKGSVDDASLVFALNQYQKLNGKGGKSATKHREMTEKS
jgi:large subunit ribosomal protein L14e